MTDTNDNDFYERLIELSLEDYYNPFDHFEWPDSLPTDRYWISPELLTIAGTPWEEKLTEADKIRLSRYETLNLFSLTFHGEQNIKSDTINYVEKRDMEKASDYLQIFLREENSHMYFFSKFCKKYGGKLYPMRQLPVEPVEDQALRRFLVFATAMIAEEAIDVLNVGMMKDERLPEFIRVLCNRHHQDESRHIAMGRHMMTSLWRAVEAKGLPSAPDIATKSLAVFGDAFLAHLYNPDAYRDAGLEESYLMRRELLASSARKDFHGQLLKRSWKDFARLGLHVDQYRRTASNDSQSDSLERAA
jgi:hypothetical protein